MCRICVQDKSDANLHCTREPINPNCLPCANEKEQKRRRK